MKGEAAALASLLFWHRHSAVGAGTKESSVVELVMRLAGQVAPRASHRGRSSPLTTSSVGSWRKSSAGLGGLAGAVIHGALCLNI